MLPLRQPDLSSASDRLVTGQAHYEFRARPDNFCVDTEFNCFLGRSINLVGIRRHLKPAISSSTEEGLVRSERTRPRLIRRVFSLKIFLLPSVQPERIRTTGLLPGTKGFLLSRFQEFLSIVQVGSKVRVCSIGAERNNRGTRRFRSTSVDQKLKLWLSIGREEPRHALTVNFVGSLF